MTKVAQDSGLEVKVNVYVGPGTALNNLPDNFEGTVELPNDGIENTGTDKKPVFTFDYSKAVKTTDKSTRMTVNLVPKAGQALTNMLVWGGVVQSLSELGKVWIAPDGSKAYVNVKCEGKKPALA